MKDLQKWDAEKVRLEGRVFELTEEKKVLAANLTKFDIDKVVVNGQIVDQEASASGVVPDAGQHSQPMPLDLDALDRFLNHEDMEEQTGGVDGHVVADHVMGEAGGDSEETL